MNRNKSRVRIGLSVGAWVFVLLVARYAGADDWPFLRGPHRNGISTETGWSSNWGAQGPAVAWRADVETGAASVVVADGRLVTMGGSKADNEEVVWCLDADSGTVLWKHVYQAKFDARQFEGGPASTPTIDGPFVYTLGYLGDVYCLNVQDGHVQWNKHLVDDFGGRYSPWKYAGSPLVTKELVIFDTGAEGNSTVALEKSTGRKVWGAGSDRAGYSTPLPFDYPDGRGVLVFKARAMVAYDLATGRELWRIDWRTTYDCNASTPTLWGDKLFISTGYGGSRARGALFQLGDGGPQQVWLNQDLETRMNSAVIYEGYGYCISELAGGQLICFDMRDGKNVWSEPGFARFGTLMIADGKLIILDEQGELVIATATPSGYQQLARSSVLQGRSWVMPVLASGRIYAKNNLGQLVCLDVRPKGADPNSQTPSLQDLHDPQP